MLLLHALQFLGLGIQDASGIGEGCDLAERRPGVQGEAFPGEDELFGEMVDVARLEWFCELDDILFIGFVLFAVRLGVGLAMVDMDVLELTLGLLFGFHP